MCEVLDRIENRGLARGREEGRAEGREQGVLVTLASLAHDGLITVQEAAKRSHLSVADFEMKTKGLIQ